MPIDEMIKAVNSYIEQEPDADLRKEAQKSLWLYENGKVDLPDIAEQFMPSLQFGTAGIRAKMGPGFNRLNKVTVAKAAFAIATNTDLCRAGVVIGYDARLNSKEFAEELADVLRGYGVKVFEFTEPVATPLCAFAIGYTKASAGVMVTASHNPPWDNGLKVYKEDGAQITQKDICAIELQLSNSPDYQQIKKSNRLSFANVIETEKLFSSYLRILNNNRIGKSEKGVSLKIVYTALHGVGYKFIQEALQRENKIVLIPVDGQCEPDGRFPTLDYPNPEEEGALDLAVSTAKKEHADLIVANDPDADRLAVALLNSSGHYQMLSGNELGALLGSYILENYPCDQKKLVVSTLVSSRQLSFMAKEHGAAYAESLTGFSKIADIARVREQEHHEKFVFGFEEALGYCVFGILRDKDGISAAICLIDLVKRLKVQSMTIWDELDRIYLRYGLTRSVQWSVRLNDQKVIPVIMKTLRELKTGQQFCGQGKISEMHDLLKEEYQNHAMANIIVFFLNDGTRIVVRPSGTEPKIKFYVEKNSGKVSSNDLKEIRIKLDEELNSLKSAVTKKLQEFR